MTDYTIFSDDGIFTVDIPPTIEVFDPPDDRYLPGYRITDNVTGDVKEYGPRLKDLNVPFSLYGLPIPITFGVRRLYGNIIWARPLKEVIKTNGSGGKGGPDTRTTTYEYLANFAVSLGIRGNTDLVDLDKVQIIKMWANGALIYDRRGTGLLKWERLSFNFHNGDPDQIADPHIESYEGVGNVPGYRDIMYIVFRDFPVSEFGNFLPSISMEVGDDVTGTYIIRNISTNVVLGSQVSSDFLVDWEAGEAYAIRGGQDENSVVRTYDLETGDFIGSAFINTTGGIGWTNQSKTAFTSDTFGISSNFEAVSYIPWLNLIVGKPDKLNTSESIMTVDPASGTVLGWGGVNALTGSGLDPGDPSEWDTPQDFYQPQIYQFYPFRVFDATGYRSFLLAQGIDSFGADVSVYALDSNHPLFITNLSPSAGTGNVIFCEGQHNYTITIMYMARGTKIEYFYVMYDATGAADPEGLVPGVHQGVGETDDFITTIGIVHSMYYYPGDNSLIVITEDSKATKYNLGIYPDDSGDPDKVTLVWSVTIPDYEYINRVNHHLDNINGGWLAWANAAGTAHELDLTFGNVTTYPESSGAFKWDIRAFCDTQRGRIASMGAVTSSGSGESDTTQTVDYFQGTLYYGRATDARMPLRDFLLGISLYAGYLESEIDIDTAIDDMIDGALIGNITSYKSILQNVCTVYRIDYFESAGTIKFVRMGLGASASDFAFTAVDFLRSSPTAPPEEATLAIRREEEISVPQLVQLRYIDKALSYNFGMQIAGRSRFITTNASSEQLSIDIPIVMTSDEAKLLATRALWGAWTSRVSYSFRTTKKHVKIEPGDFGTITWEGRTITARVVQVTYNTDFSINVVAVNAVSDEAITVVSDTGNGSGEEPIIPVPAKTTMFILDVPLLETSDDLASTGTIFRLYWGLGGRPSSSWLGGTGYLGPKAKQLAAYGSTNHDLTQFKVLNNPDREDAWSTWDEVNTLMVRLVVGDATLLIDQTKAEVLAGSNLCAYGKPGRYELIAFREVTDNGNGTYTLSGLLRGLLGTSIQLDTHRAGDDLILLNADVQEDDLPNSLAGSKQAYKGVTFGQAFTAVEARSVTIHGYAGQCLPVSGLKITRDIGGDGKLKVRWRRNSRHHGSMVDGVENATLTAGELNEYRVTVWRWPHYDSWKFQGGEWVGSDTGDAKDYVVYEVVGTSLNITAAMIRDAELYEFDGPDNPSSSSSTFSQQPGSFINTSEVENEQVVDLGYDEFVAFKYLDVKVQQKNASPGLPTWGPGVRQRIYIRDL
jgi:hypothetical protein